MGELASIGAAIARPLAGWPTEAGVSSAFAILGGSIALVVVLITWLRLPAFLALVVSAALGEVMIVVTRGTGHDYAGAVAQVGGDFGTVAGKLGITIALATVIGAAMLDSGAADKITLRVLYYLGERYASAALLICAFALSVPIYVDTVLLLLLPIARALTLRTGRGALASVLAVGAGATIANGTIPPAPGPLFMAEALKLNIGVVAAFACLLGLIPALAALWTARSLDRRMQVPIRETTVSAGTAPAHELRSESDLPALWSSLLPIAFPFALIAAASIAMLPVVRPHVPMGWAPVLQLLGEKNVALAVGALVGVILQAKRRGLRGPAIGGALIKPLEAAGVIILIVAAGGAYGKMIERTGLGEAVRHLAGGREINLLLLGWGMAAVMRIAQGSATVAVITAVGVVTSVAGSAGFPVHPFYVLIAIGYGSKFMPWMNDVGFWLFSRIGGLTAGETFRGWTVMSSVMAVIGLIQVLIVAKLYPHPPF